MVALILVKELLQVVVRLKVDIEALRDPLTHQDTLPPVKFQEVEPWVLDPPGRLRVNSELKCWISPCSGLTARPTAPEPQAAMVKYRSRRVDELLMLVVFLIRGTGSAAGGQQWGRGRKPLPN